MSLSLQNRHEEEECKKVLITGSNQGIGLATAIALAKKGDYNITLACRNEARAQAAVKTVREAAAQVISKDVQVRYVLVDLAQLESVHKLLANFRASGEFFDVVVLNAGVLLPSDRITVDGVESSFQVNFVSQFLLVRELIAYQCPEHPLRVVTLTSVLHRFCGPVFSVRKNPSKWRSMFDCPQRQWKAYAMSKWGTAMLAVALNRMEKNVSAISIHPGVVQTGMIQALTRTHVSPAKNAGQPSRIHAKLSAIRARLRQRIASCVMLTPAAAAENVVFCVAHPEAFGPNEYSNAGRKEKLNKSVLNASNWLCLENLAEQIILEATPKQQSSKALPISVVNPAAA